MFQHFNKIIFILCILSMQICWATNEATKHEELANNPQTLKNQTIKKSQKTMNEVKIENIKDITVACIKHSGSYSKIGEAFDKLFFVAKESNLLNQNTPTIGIFYDNPNKTAEKNLRSKACIVVDYNFEEKEGLEKVIIEGGKYGVYIHKGPYSQFKDIYDYLFYGVWLVQNRQVLKQKPNFAEYLNSPKNTDPSELLTKIYIPLK